MQREALRLDVAHQLFEPLRFIERIELRRRDDLHALGDRRLRVLGASVGFVERQFAADDLEVLDRVAAAERRHVDQVKQHGAALDVAEEAMPRPAPDGRLRSGRERRPPRSCGRRGVDNAKVGYQCREGIVGDLRLGGGDTEISVDLPALGKPTRPTSASSLRCRCSETALAWLAGILSGVGPDLTETKVRVAVAAATAARDQHAIAVGDRSATSPVSPARRRRRTVPAGTGMSRSSPPARCCSCLRRCPAVCALNTW